MRTQSRSASVAATVVMACVSICSAQAIPKVHLVKAGSGGFNFEPDRLDNVAVGDVVTFEFYPPDHSVARAEFGSPCMPYEETGANKTGFWSQTQIVKTARDVGVKQALAIIS